MPRLIIFMLRHQPFCFGFAEHGESFIAEYCVDSDKFERFSNNGEYLRKGKEFEILETFTHWTYVATGTAYLLNTQCEIMCTLNSICGQ